jgi:glycosyltransferase involved in cell wall biosynthesis
MTEQKITQVGWKVSQVSTRIASVRYRCLFPLLALRASNIKSTMFDDSRASNLDGLEVLVLVKPMSAGDLALAQEASSRGISVIVDLCDNIFVEAYVGKAGAIPSQTFINIASFASVIVVTTVSLEAIVRQHVTGQQEIIVIPDGLETAETVRAADAFIREIERLRSKSLSALFYRALSWVKGKRRFLRSVAVRKLIHRYYRVSVRLLKRLSWRQLLKRSYFFYDFTRAALTNQPRRVTRPILQTQPAIEFGAVDRAYTHRLIWFGNHGADHARFGMLDLLDIAEALDQVGNEFDCELIIVSNSEEKFDHVAKQLRIPARYFPWTIGTTERELSRASVALLPNSKDAFSICKSANRAVLALAANVPVVATLTPALEPLADCIQHDDFLVGIRTYLQDKTKAENDVFRAQAIIESNYGKQAIASHWLRAFAFASQAPKAKLGAADLIVALHLIQDLDLAMPVIIVAQKRGIKVVACCSTSLIRKSPRVMTALSTLGLESWILDEHLTEPFKLSFPAQTKALLTIAESSLGPHSFTHKLTQVAAARGIRTGTMQHGFENIGLTYTDEIHAVEKIDIASDHIFLWCPVSQLHPKVKPSNRKKCISVGSVKPAALPVSDLTELALPAGKVIGIFENLHWHRYSDEYRQFFLEGVYGLAQKFPQITFLVKPHHAGKWLTGRYKGEIASFTNLVIADPSLSPWEKYTAPSLMNSMVAVITSPSTVALDAARAAIPVALVRFDLELKNYEPLPMIGNSLDWSDFVSECLSDSSNAVRLANSFAQASVMPGSASERILDTLLGENFQSAVDDAK